MDPAGQHLLSLLDNVIEMARLNAAVLRSGAEPVHLAEVAREAVHMLIPTADTKLQTLQLGTPAEVTVNLIGNAVKFTPEGGSVTVSTAELTLAGAAWGEIRVIDSGPGIADAEKAAIFEPYYRSEGTVQLPGVGLGLAISHALVQQMGGELGVETEVGVGSSFIVRFPCSTRPARV